MWIQFEHPSGPVKIDTASFHDLSIAIRKTGNVNCYYLSDPEFAYYESEAFSGSLANGGSVNCEKISLYPHASGTHTECALHVVPCGFDMRHVQIPPLMLCRLVTADPEMDGMDRIINRKALGVLNNDKACEALMVRTKPNTGSKLHENYSGTNPPYFQPELLSELQDLGFRHLLTDLPSIDKESDEGRLQAHKNWFLENGVASPDRTITELIYVPDNIPDGVYALSIQAPAIETDAVPSRILIYPCV